MKSFDNFEGSSTLEDNTFLLAPLIEIQYLPCLAYFALLKYSGSVVLEKHENFVKQSLRNRCYINTEHGKDVLSIPLTDKHGKVPVTEVKIDYSQKWVSNHWRTIVSAYARAPFFEHYAGDLEKVLFSRYTFLYDLNYQLLTLCLKWLRFEITVMESLSYEKEPILPLKDFRSFLNAKNKGNIDYVYKAVPYYQVFGNAFAENLSIIDLVFCCGPEAGSIIKASVRSEQLPN